MPIISQFYGIVIQMFFKEDDSKHHLPHVHAMYNEFNAVYDFQGNLLEGKMPIKQSKLVEAWILLHSEELGSLWKLMKNGEEFFKIDPLK